MLKLLQKLKFLDSKIEQTIKDGSFIKNKDNFKKFWNTLLKFIDTRTEIKKKFIEAANFIIEDKSLEELLRNVSSNKKFIADFVIELLGKDLNDSDNFLMLDENEIDELASNSLFSWFGPREYIMGMMEIGVIVIKISLPKIFNSFLDEARKCYAFQQYNAVNALSRTILEIAIKDIYMRKIVKYKVKETKIRQQKVSSMIYKISTGEFRKKIRFLYYDKLCPVVHGDKSLSNIDVKIYLRETINIIEELYDVSYNDNN